MDPKEFMDSPEHKMFKEFLMEKIERLSDEDERQNKRISLLEDSISKLQTLTISVEKMALSIETMAKELEKQGKRLDSIEKEPAENWKKAVWIVIAFGIGAALSIISVRIGLAV